MAVIVINDAPQVRTLGLADTHRISSQPILSQSSEKTLCPEKRLPRLFRLHPQSCPHTGKTLQQVHDPCEFSRIIVWQVGRFYRWEILRQGWTTTKTGPVQDYLVYLISRCCPGPPKTRGTPAAIHITEQEEFARNQLKSHPK